MAPLPACTPVSGTLSGRVFQDFNFNGADDQVAGGVAGIEVYVWACDASGASMPAGNTVTASDGSWSVGGLTDGQEYRVEYVLPAALDFLSFGPVGPDSKTHVEHVTAPACDLNVGVADPNTYHQADPLLVMPCYINGDPLAGGTAGDTTALVAVNYSASGQGQNIELADAKEVGALWGIAYQRQTKTIFTSAVLRRHSGFGPGGTGAIYALHVPDIDNPTIVPQGIIDLDALGFDTGTDPRTGMDVLPPNRDQPSHDSLAFTLVGKMSIGDVDLSADGRTLYAVNLFSRSLIEIDLSNYIDNGVLPTAAQITSTPIPDPGCSNGDYVPWALKFYRGKLYVGVVCTAETSQNPADLHAWVYEYNGTNFTPYFDFSLDFQRGPVFFQLPAINKWFPWTSDHNKVINGGAFAYPQPILSDIEFDFDGSLILGFMDRTSMQGGHLNYSPDYTDNTLYITFSGGDLLRVCNVNGTLTLEGNGGCLTSLGTGHPQGPGGSEYYWSDYYHYQPTNPNPDPATNPGIIHNEVTLGALAYLAGSGQIVSTVFDPGDDVNTGGISWFSNAEGDRDRSYQVFEAVGVSFPGKANGLGDLDLMCDIAPVEIGNYLWADCNNDGIQDPCEDPLPGVRVTLFDANCDSIATVVTDANGQYLFNDAVVKASPYTTDTMLQPDATYHVVVGIGQFDTGNGTLMGMTLAPADVGMGPEPDHNDSDGTIGGAGGPPCVVGFPFVSVQTPELGGADHSYDFGFTSNVEIVSVQVVHETCPDANDGSISVDATGTGPLEYSIDNGMTWSPDPVFTNLMPGDYTVIVRLQGAGAMGVCHAADTALVTVQPAPPLNPPTTQPYQLCQYEQVPQGEGLIAICNDPCPNGTPEVRWYDAATGGMLVATGSPFDPIAAGLVDPAVPGTYTFYASCFCDPCESDRTPATFTVLPLPAPEISGETVVCPEEELVYQTPFHAGSTYQWTLLSGGAIISQTANVVTVQWADLPNSGPHLLVVKETDANGCMASDTIEVLIKDTELVCVDMVQVSLDENGKATLTPDLFLQGNYNTYEGFLITIKDAQGHVIPGNMLFCDDIGQTFIITVMDECTDNSCWSSVKLEDKLPPVITCPPDVSASCAQGNVDPGLPMATDNCTAQPELMLIDQLTLGDACSGIHTVYTWIAVDEQGLESEPCSVEVWIEGNAGITFPLDVAWTCSHYAAFPQITEPQPLHACLTQDAVPATPVFDVLLDPTCNDGNDASALCSINPANNAASTGCPGPGLDDADVLAATGSGVPAGAGGLCSYSVSHSDQVIATCGTSFKIIRTWTVLDWCAGVVINEDAQGNDNVQVIKVVDVEPPVIEVPQPFVLGADQPAAHPQVCHAQGLLPAPQVTDDCSGWTVRIFTDAGEAIYVNGTDGSQGGYIPAPGLPLGTHQVLYQAIDDCGNSSELYVTLEVVDQTAPVAICDEITSANLNTDGVAVVFAETFDDGSFDNCCLDHFEARRMDHPNAPFAPSVTFTCSDEEVGVVMRAWDCSGNYSDCMVVVNVADKLPPATVSCPEGQTITCTDWFDTYAQAWLLGDQSIFDGFGQPQFFDNCDFTVSYHVQVNIDQCGAGTIVRTWTATDAAANGTAACEQIIQVVNQEDWLVSFPPDLSVQCGQSVPDFGTPQIISDDCELIAITWEDQHYPIAADACYKIVRKWTVINWCNFDPEAGNAVVEAPESALQLDLDGDGDSDNRTYKIGLPANLSSSTQPDGMIMHQQIIKVVDEQPPVITCPPAMEVCLDSDCSGATVQVSQPDVMDCSPELSLTAMSDMPGFDGTTATAHNVPEGTWQVTWKAVDNCGNSTVCATSVTVKDCKKPTAYCDYGLAIELMQTGTVTIWASDLDAGSYDNCGGTVSLSFGPDPSQQSLQFTCADIGQYSLELWVTDAAGNQDFCETFVIVQDNMGACQGLPSIAGTIAHTSGSPLTGVDVALNGALYATTQTTADGTYVFTDLQPGHDYTVSPHYDGDPLEGVSTFDLVLIARHILGTQPFDSPYQYLAADANLSQSVSTFDMVLLRQLILHQIDEVPAGSWRFVDAHYVFPDPMNPWLEPVPEVVNYNDLSADQLATDFTGIKIGDVDGSVAFADLDVDDRSMGTRYLWLEDHMLAQGEQVELMLRAGDAWQMTAMEGSLSYDPEALRLELPDFEGLLDEQSVHIVPGRLYLAWFEPFAHDVQPNDPLLRLRFTALRDLELSEVVRLSANETRAWAESGAQIPLALSWEQETLGEVVILGQNQPNPFGRETAIPFWLPEGSEVSFEVFDLTGRKVLSHSGWYAPGKNHWKLRLDAEVPEGVLYYRMRCGEAVFTRKMIYKPDTP